MSTYDQPADVRANAEPGADTPVNPTAESGQQTSATEQSSQGQSLGEQHGEGPAAGSPPGRTAYENAGTNPPPADAGPSTQSAPPTAESSSATESPSVSPARSGRDAETSLFSNDDTSGFHSRWLDIQATFVDDPRECVQRADGLVSDVINQLTAGFAEARTNLEQQWGRGEDASTEDLRLTLKRYR
ncbi:MAG: hypothetical protein JO280_06185, partial [Mycobacteriaceae bacterium]|nr:hypothetical protein [Mycobacteriaceae bacterium]